MATSELNVISQNSWFPTQKSKLILTLFLKKNESICSPEYIMRNHGGI